MVRERTPLVAEQFGLQERFGIAAQLRSTKEALARGLVRCMRRAGRPFAGPSLTLDQDWRHSARPLMGLQTRAPSAGGRRSSDLLRSGRRVSPCGGMVGGDVISW